MTHHPLHAFFRAETGRAVDPGPDTCWFCGASCHGAARVADIVRSTFSDMDRARAGADGPVCEACAFYLDFKFLRPGQKRGMGLYTKTVIVWAGAEPRWEEWPRERMADDVLRWDEYCLPEPAYLTCNYSKQKHVLPWAKLSSDDGSRPWISTDNGDVLLRRDFPGLLWCLAWLWSRGYPKTLLPHGVLAAHALAKSDNPALDLRAAGALRRIGAGPELEYLSYIVTEDNRDRLCDSLAGRAATLLGCDVPRPTGGSNAGRDPQLGSRPDVQEPLPPEVVAAPGGAGQARGDDEPGPDALEQLGLW